MEKRRSLVWISFAISLSALFMWTACGGGGGSSNQATSTTFNASAAAGDYIKITRSAGNVYTYDNFTTGRFESGTYDQDPATGELSFTADTSTGGGSGDGNPSELATGFIAPGIGVVLIATHTGAAMDKESIVFGVPERTHSLDEIIGLVEPGTGGSADYIYLQFRTNDGGFELGAAKIFEEQDFTDTLDIDEDGDDADTITGAPLMPASYSPVYGMPDPTPGSSVDMTFSTDIVDSATSTPFLDLAPDGSHIILSSWEYDTCNKGDLGCTPTLAGNIMFFNDTLEKIILDSPYSSGIVLAMGGSDGWSSANEGTYTMVSYVGSGRADTNQDTAGIPENLELVFGNDGGNGTISVGPLGGPYSSAQPLTPFNDMAQAGSLLGNPASPWPTDGSIPLNGAFGFRGTDGTLGSETFFVFSEGVVFMLSASLDGPRISGGDLDGYPTSYFYQFGAGIKVP